MAHGSWRFAAALSAVLIAVSAAGFVRERRGPSVVSATHLRSTTAPTATATVSHAARFPIQHIVIIVKENRSFDQMFGRFPGADGATTARLPSGKLVPLGHTPDHTLLDIGHAGDSAAFAVDGGR